MTARVRSLALAGAQLALLLSLGGKLLVDRARLPHAWVRTAPVDPDDPLRGRYVRLGLEVAGTGFADDSVQRFAWQRARLVVHGDSLVAIADSGGPAQVTRARRDDARMRLSGSVAYFIPEHVPDPSRRPPGEELWVDVTLPRSGAPRPIRLGVRRDGRITPLDF